MATLVTDSVLEQRLREERKASGADRFDEVWEGIYDMPPMPNDEQQEIVSRLAAVFQMVVGWDSPDKVYAGVNVSDREESWTTNYRVPDVAVFRSGTVAKDCGSHWFRGPDLAVEVVSRGDRPREKLLFYEAIGTKEVWSLERDPWRLEVFRLEGSSLISSGTTGPDSTDPLESSELPITIRLKAT